MVESSNFIELDCVLFEREKKYIVALTEGMLSRDGASIYSFGLLLNFILCLDEFSQFSLAHTFVQTHTGGKWCDCRGF